MKFAFATAAALVLLGGAARADGTSIAEFDRNVERELSAHDPIAATQFRQASAARDRADWDAAIEGFTAVEQRVPSSSHAFRRHASIELMQQHWQRALELAEQAVALERSAPNLVTQAQALVRLPRQSAERRGWAVALAKEAGGMETNDPLLQAQVAEVAVVAPDLDLLATAVFRLQRVDGDGPATWYFRSLLESANGDFDAALTSLDQAHAHGLPDAAYRSRRAGLRHEQPTYHRLLPLALWLTGAWLVAGFTLFLVGLVLSALTLRASRRVSLQPNWHAGGGEVGLRRLYAAVIGLCCAYYYVSIPFALGAVLVGGGGILYLCYAAGGAAIKLMVIVGVGMFVTVGAVWRSLTVRAPGGDPGLRLRLDEHPRLARVLRAVAGRVGTRAVDSVYLTPDASVAVTERGGLVAQLRGTSERCLILGVAVLDGIDAGALKAVLAHEYGHFVNRDTAGGGLALLVRRSVLTMAAALARGGAATWWNPAWWFVNGFHRLFLRISQGASRLQEVLADRWAAAAYGGDAFERGLRHVLGASIRFDVHTHATVTEIRRAKAPLLNLYRHQLAQPIDEKSVALQLDEILRRKASPYDSHPPPADRIAWVKAVRAGGSAQLDDGEPAWSWLGDRERCEREMTAVVREFMRTRYGVHIPATVPAAAATG